MEEMAPGQVSKGKVEEAGCLGRGPEGGWGREGGGGQGAERAQRR